MRPPLSAARLCTAWFAVLLPAAATVAALPDEVVVTATRLPGASLGVAGNTSRIGRDRIDLLNAAHVHELGTQLPGTWISRGSGQEHLTAIRSPVLTGPGSCGSFLFLEDGVALRPAGFCNVNGLFEVPAEQADAIEVIRGPANALYGSNAVHGTINVLLPVPGAQPGWLASGQVGPNDFYRARLRWDSGPGDHAAVAGLIYDNDGGFRDDSGYRQAKGFAKYRKRIAPGDLELAFSGSLLDQETAGFIAGKDAYRDDALRTTNPNPESYRDASSQRLYARFTPATNTAGDGWDVVATLRRSRMDFLQHFLPGQPTEENGQESAALTLTRYRSTDRLSLTGGFDVEVARGFLEEFQSQPETGTPPRPQGLHYDYRVQQYLAATYLQARWALASRWELSGGIRLEYLRYDYDNRMIDGNTRADGTPCTPACLFNRPADRNDGFLNLAPNLGLLYRLSERSSAYLTLTRGFRAPQAAELYRLQSRQSVADLDSESIDSAELGWRFQAPWARVGVAAFAMEKRNYILQDSNRFNVSDGRSTHTGVELDLRLQARNGIYGAVAATWARQVYGFSTRIPGGEVITDGNDIDTAPRTLGSARIGWDREGWLAEAEWLHMGRYYLTAEETADYPGHDLLNLRGTWRASDAWSVTVRLNNALDERYADRADFAFGEYRYFPGRDRELFFEVAYRSE
jgi:outer membrane receptor protein involved in Fe transport